DDEEPATERLDTQEECLSRGGPAAKIKDAHRYARPSNTKISGEPNLAAARPLHLVVLRPRFMGGCPPRCRPCAWAIRRAIRTRRRRQASRACCRGRGPQPTRPSYP